MNYAHIEEDWDALLKVHTCGRDDSMSGQMNFPYEPTPYAVLDRFSNTGYVCKSNTLIDYGCGKGRVSFYFAYQTRCHTIGVDFDARMIAMCKENAARAVSGARTNFVQGSAEDFIVPTEADRCFFFNPFSVAVLEKVYGQLLASVSACPREVLLFFYYPSKEYLDFLDAREDLVHVEDISCRDLFAGEDSREMVCVYKLKI